MKILNIRSFFIYYLVRRDKANGLKDRKGQNAEDQRRSSQIRNIILQVCGAIHHKCQ